MIKVTCHKLIVTDKLHMTETCFFHRGHKTLVFFLSFFFSFLTSTQNSHNSILRLFSYSLQLCSSYETNWDIVHCSVDTDMWGVSFRVNGEGFLKNRIRASWVVKCNLKTGRMAHWIKALATKSHGLSSRPRIHVEEGERNIWHVVSDCMCHTMRVHKM